ncbi:MAG: pyrrolo-quinoline quinone [Proteobacteria bacterium]|nr:pyrrolo-quinoline quinone [Pseudomonadota bacterium]
MQQAPVAQSVAVGQSATFTVVATGSAPLAYQWLRNGQPLAGATGTSYQTAPAAAADNGAAFAVTVSNAYGSTTSPAATLAVTGLAGAVDVLTYHNDNARTAQNLGETVLTPATVAAAGFGLLRVLPADGLVDAQPLVVSSLAVGGRSRNVVFVVTEHGSVYSYDADDGTALVHASLVPGGEAPSDARGCDQVTPEIGITATPVIDRGANAHGTLYAVAMTRDAGGQYHQRLHALDLVTLAEQAGSPVEIAASFPGSGANSSNGRVAFDPGQYKARTGLALVNGVVYTAWASHCDIDPYTGWIIGYDGHTLAQSGVLNVTPNGSEGAIWQAGGGLAADAAGNLYALVGNGTFDTALDGSGRPSAGDYGNAFIKVATGGALAVADYFAESNDVAESGIDLDLGSGAPMLLPPLQDAGGVTRNLAVGAGKDGHLYVVDRASMGGFNASRNAIWQDLPGALPGGVWSAPAYFNGTVYYADVGGTLKAFALGAARLAATPASQSSMTFPYPGASPAVSASGSTNAIVWALESATGQRAVLHAFDATNLANELYNSDQAAGGRDHFGNGNKFVTPTVANGKVYVGTPSGVAVFGRL